MKITEYIDNETIEVALPRDLGVLIVNMLYEFEQYELLNGYSVLSFYLLQFELIPQIDLDQDESKVILTIPIAVSIIQLYIFFSTRWPGDDYDLEFSELDAISKGMTRNFFQAAYNSIGEEKSGDSPTPSEN
jgi:hypothetical protein